jgi:hypothetical protein
VTSCHGRRQHAVHALTRFAKLFQDPRQIAEQLTIQERWLRIVAEAL